MCGTATTKDKQGNVYLSLCYNSILKLTTQPVDGTIFNRLWDCMWEIDTLVNFLPVIKLFSINGYRSVNHNYYNMGNLP